jgi:hypothetical protein
MKAGKNDRAKRRYMRARSLGVMRLHFTAVWLCRTIEPSLSATRPRRSSHMLGLAERPTWD